MTGLSREDRSDRWAVALVLLGVALRVVGCVRWGSLAEDELALSLNIVTRGFRSLLLPLQYAQTAPVPFLWGERAAVALLGVSDFSLRLIPFLCGCAVLVLLWRVGARLVARQELLLALGLAATSPFLLEYSAEVKPYGLDAVVALAMAGTALALVREPASRRSWGAVILAGTAALLCSTPAPFVLFGATGAVVAAVHRRPEAWPRALAAFLIWGAAFGLVYTAVYRHAAQESYLRQYWAFATLAPGPRWGARFGGAIQEALWPVSYWMVRAHLAFLLLAACAAGLVTIAKRRGWVVAWLLAAPPAALFLAALLGRYPVAMRLMLFATPLLTLAAAAGIMAGARWIARQRPSIRPRVVAVAILIPSVMIGVVWSIEMPGGRTGLPQLVREFDRLHQAGEPLYLSHRVSAEWAYHTTDWRNPDRARLAWVGRIAGAEGPGFSNGGRQGPRALAVPDTAVYDYRGLTELYGLSSGVMGRAWLAVDPDDLPDWSTLPDSGWAESEVARLRDRGPGRSWAVFSSGAPAPELASWRRALNAAGGRIVLRREAHRAILYAVRFGSTPPAP